VSDLVCGNWSECIVDYNLEDILDNNLALKGKQTRLCVDKNNFNPDRLENQECDKKYLFTTVKRCNYLEVYSNQTLVARLGSLDQKISSSADELNVQITINDKDYAPSCYNGVKDSDEDEIDCVYKEKGCCQTCEEKTSLTRKLVQSEIESPEKKCINNEKIIWLIIIVILLFLISSVLVIIVFRYFTHKENIIKITSSRNYLNILLSLVLIISIIILLYILRCLSYSLFFNIFQVVLISLIVLLIVILSIIEFYRHKRAK